MPTNCSSERGIVILPDILANAGGVTVSYFEWVQNRQHYQWGINRVRQELDRVLAESFEAGLGTVGRAQGQPAHRRLHAGHRPSRPGHHSGRHHMIEQPVSAQLLDKHPAARQLQRDRAAADGRYRHRQALRSRRDHRAPGRRQPGAVGGARREVRSGEVLATTAPPNRSCWPC